MQNISNQDTCIYMYVIKCMLTIPRKKFQLAYDVDSCKLMYIQHVQRMNKIAWTKCLKLLATIAMIAKSKPVIATWEFF